MKKYIISAIAVVIIAAVAAWNVGLNLSSQNSSLSDIQLANVEALADGESGGGSDGCKWKIINCPWPKTSGYGVCISNGDGGSCPCGSTTHDPLPC